jgi:hypothetical protein
LLQLPSEPELKGAGSSVSSNSNQMSQVTIILHEESLASKLYE